MRTDILVITAATRPPKRRPRARDARRTQERRDPERPLTQLRYMDEPHSEGGGADESCMIATLRQLGRPDL